MPTSHHNHPEPSERTKPKLIQHGKNWKTYPPEWTQRIERIATIQAQLQDTKALGLDWSDLQFTKDLAIKNVWPSMRLGLYPLPSTATTNTKWLRELDALEQHAQANLRRIDDSQAREERSLEGFVETTDCKAVKRAIAEAKKRASTHNQDRAVAYIAKTGGGKTTLAMHLLEEKLVHWYVEATPSWKRSYRALLLSLASTWSLPTKNKQSTLDLETLVIAHARTLSGVILFEEVDTLCSSSQEFLKLLLNRSTLVVVMFMTPEAREALRAQGGSQLQQLFRRFEAQIIAAPIRPADIIPFDPDLWSRATEQQLNAVATAANAMGSIDAVKRIGSNITGLGGESVSLSEEKITKAINLYRMAVPVVRTKQQGRAA